MTKKSTPTPPMTLHSLLGALSFWGTATRTMLFSFLAVAIYIVALTEAASPSAADYQTMIFVYVLGSFLLLDFGYVMIARAYTLQKGLDMLALICADIFLALLYIVPKIVVTSSIAVKVDPLLYVIFIPIVVLAVRMLLGIVFGGRPR